MFKRKRHLIISIIILVVALVFGITIGAFTWIIHNTPNIDNYYEPNEASFVYSADGQLLTKLYKQNRVYVPLERVPNDLQNAIITIEDTNFEMHLGIDIMGIIRAFIINLREGRRAQGASTITQQLAGNVLLDRQEKTYYRKIQEAYLALQFERLYTKNEILEMYLNEIYLGHTAYGVQTAAQQYFGKNVWELNLSESALIAGLPRNPNGYSPFNNFEAAIRRRNIVLNRMFELNYISKREYNQARSQEIVLRSRQIQQEEIAPYFVRYVRDQLLNNNLIGAEMLYGGGLKIYTTLDLSMQKKAEATIEKALEQYIPTIEIETTGEQTQPQIALVTIDPKTGGVRAMVGGRGFDQFNRATQAQRQPGSAFKTFVYTTAINQGYSPGSIINDMPLAIRQGSSTWQPRNYDNNYRGYITLRTALNNSINIPAVKLMQEVGGDNVIQLASKMGISTLSSRDNVPSLALGATNVTPLDMASAYGVFANSGIKAKPFVIEKIIDNKDRVIYQAHPERSIVLAEDTNQVMVDMLQSVITDGTGWRANLQRPAGGKTGTTNNYTDAWFVGFTPDLVTSVWIGEDGFRGMEYVRTEDGSYRRATRDDKNTSTIESREAVRIWGDYMRQVVQDMPITHFPEARNITTIDIDPITGLLPNTYTPRTISEVFRNTHLPLEKEKLHQPIEKVKINKKNGLLACEYCPEDEIVEYEYFKNSGIKVGPRQISFGDADDQSVFSGTYIVSSGEPVQQIDLETGIPLTDENGQVLYEKKPSQKCEEHTPEEVEEEHNFFNNFWRFIR